MEDPGWLLEDLIYADTCLTCSFLEENRLRKVPTKGPVLVGIVPEVIDVMGI